MRLFMSKKIYVGNLPHATSENELQNLFANYGEVVSAQIITDRATGRSKGFGFVEMSNDAEAQAAIEALNGSELGGRPLTVNEAKPREERPRGSFRSSGGFRDDRRGGGDRDRRGRY